MKQASTGLMVIIIVITSLFSFSPAQEVETLMGSDKETGFLWGFGTKTASIQDDLSTTWGGFASVLFNHKIGVGFKFGANVTHPEVNHSYAGIFARYTHEPLKLVHYSGEIFLGRGSTKDYELKKTSLMDNFGNTSGPGFNIIEPGVNVEVNMHSRFRLVAGVSYRLISGLDEDHELIAKTGVTNDDFSGLNFNLGLKIGLH
jgi:hypothetical protein